MQPTTLITRFERARQMHPHSPFLLFEHADRSVRAWSYDEFDLEVRRAMSALADVGVGCQDRVHVALPNSPAFVAAWLATMRLGATFVPVDPRSTSPELREQLRRVSARVGICSSTGRGNYDEAADDAVDVLAVDPDAAHPFGEGGGRTDALEVSEPAEEAAILFTSGTTSAPKGVVVTPANYAFAGAVMAEASGLRAAHRCLVVLPLFHANAQYYSFAAAIYAGASVALTASFSASRFTHQARRMGATHASLFAAPMRMILARTPSGAGVELQHCWYAQNLHPDQLEAFTALVRCKPRQLYGMTETLAAVITQRPDDARAGVMGTVTDGCGLTLRDADGEEADAGEIVVSGRRGHELFLRYLDDPMSTAAAFVWDGFSTGDLARRDVDGHLRFDGRQGDLIKVAGENVSAVHIETVLEEHPEVLEVAVAARPDPVRDEVPVAYVVRTSGAQVDEQALLEHAGRALAPSKRPHQVVFVDELPRTSVGKVRKQLLGQRAPRAAVGASAPDARAVALSKLIDYAGLFPPAALSMPEAVTEHLRWLADPLAWIVDRFACPASHVDELARHLPQPGAGITLILKRGDGDVVAEVGDQLRAITDAQARARVQAADLALAWSREGREANDVTALLRSELPSLRSISFETRPTAIGADVESDVAAIVDHAGRAAGSGLVLGAKLRLGGTVPEAVPGVATVASFLRACVAAHLPFKFTAGLHHPVRRLDDALGVPTHGFLNLLAATAALLDGGGSALEFMLDERDPDAFRLDHEHLRWRQESWDVARLAAARRLFGGFGCCSIAEPATDLLDMGLVAA